MRLSQHFHLDEMTISQTATRLKINNTPSERDIARLRDLCENVLEPVRSLFNKPVVISSGYRSLALNRAIGSKDSSQHTKGEAADFTIPGFTVTEVFDAIRASKIPFDQLIDEGGAWIHVSFTKRRKNRRMAFRIDF